MFASMVLVHDEVGRSREATPQHPTDADRMVSTMTMTAHRVGALHP